MTLNKARKILGESGNKFSRSKLKRMVQQLTNLANVFIEQQKGLANYENTTLQ